VKGRRRVTWIQLSQHAQVVAVDDRTLTVGFNNPGARESFVNGRSDLILQQVLIDLVGQEYRVEAIVDPAAQAGGGPQTEPAARGVRPPARPDPSRATAAVGEPVKGAGSGNDAPAEPASRAAVPPDTGPPQPGPPQPSDEDAHPDDPDARDELAGADLLTERLGARVIEEIPHS